MSKFGISNNEEVLLSKAYNGLLTSTLATAKRQRDIFLNEDKKIINFTNDLWSEITFDLYQDGLYSLTNIPQKSELIINLNWKFINNTLHLPFYFMVMVGTGADDIIFKNSYGHFNETYMSVNLVCDISNTIKPRYFIKKIFNDPGSIEIQKNSYITMNTF